MPILEFKDTVRVEPKSSKDTFELLFISTRTKLQLNRLEFKLPVLNSELESAVNYMFNKFPHWELVHDK